MFLFDTTLLTLKEVGKLIGLKDEEAIKSWLHKEKIQAVIPGKRKLYPIISIKLILEVKSLESFMVTNPDDWETLYLDLSGDVFLAKAALSKIGLIQKEVAIKTMNVDDYSNQIDYLIYGK